MHQIPLPVWFGDFLVGLFAVMMFLALPISMLIHFLVMLRHRDEMKAAQAEAFHLPFVTQAEAIEVWEYAEEQAEMAATALEENPTAIRVACPTHTDEELQRIGAVMICDEADITIYRLPVER